MMADAVIGAGFGQSSFAYVTGRSYPAGFDPALEKELKFSSKKVLPN